MAQTATIHHFEVALSDVDRGVYEALDLRVAQHPSETMRFMLTRTLAYCLSYEEGIAFSKGGISSVDEPPISIKDPTGILLAWIEIGAPSWERLHRASKAARRVAIFTHALAQLRRETSGKTIHKADAIEVWPIETAFLDALEPRIERNTKLDLTRNDGQLYAVIDGVTIETALSRTALEIAS